MPTICYDEYSKNDMRACTYDEHRFCLNGLENYIKVEVFEKNVLQVECTGMSLAAGQCKGTFNSNVIDEAIPMIAFVQK